VKALIDTHALIWAATEVGRLSERAAAVIGDPRYEILVSAASAWEIATKVRLGRLPSAQAFEENLQAALDMAGYGLRTRIRLTG
jgi:PIN domain nuclease of toxin-antitoxin system